MRFLATDFEIAPPPPRLPFSGHRISAPERGHEAGYSGHEQTACMGLDQENQAGRGVGLSPIEARSGVK